MRESPFVVLKLPPTATAEEIVRQGARLCRQLADEPSRDAVRQAVRELTEGDARLLHALLTHPNPRHDDASISRFIAAHTRPPRAANAAPCPPVDIEEFRDLLLSNLAGEVSSTPLPLERADGEEPADEIERQTAEALWQSLPAQPRG